MGCEFAQNVWKESPACIPPSFDVSLPFVAFIERALKQLVSPGLEFLLTTTWVLRNAINETYWEGKVIGATELSSRAAGYAIDFLDVGHTDIVNTTRI